MRVCTEFTKFGIASAIHSWFTTFFMLRDPTRSCLFFSSNYLSIYLWRISVMNRNSQINEPHYCLLALVLRLGVKSLQLSFCLSKKFLFSVGRCPFVTFPEYEMGTKYNNHAASQLVHRKLFGVKQKCQTRVIF